MRTIHIFQGMDGYWWWHAKAKGRIVENSAEGYATRSHCKRAIAAKLKATYRVE